MLIEEAVKGYSEAEIKRITELTKELKISPDDPLFQLLATLGRHEEMMIEIAARLEALGDAWAIMFDQKMEKASNTAKNMHQRVVSSAVREELNKAIPSSSISLGRWQPGLWMISCILGGVMAAGAMLGSLVTWNVVNLKSTSTITKCTSQHSHCLHRK
jgi:hypothetical protein